MVLKHATNGAIFIEEAKEFVANMEGNKKMLHRKGNPSCPWASFLETYVDFETLEEAENFLPRLSKCQKCFNN